MADWWYTKNGERQGPVSSSQLRQLAQSGDLLPTDMVFKEGGSEWKLASTVSNLFPGGGGGIRSERPGREDRDRGDIDFDRRDDRRRDDRDDRDDRDRDDDYDDRPSVRKTKGGASGKLMDLLMFRSLGGPILSIILFWIFTLFVVGYGLYLVGEVFYYAGGRGIWIALRILVAIPITVLVIRLWTELAIAVFRMNDKMTDVKNALDKDQRPKS
jgi:hypothetical protein